MVCCQDEAAADLLAECFGYSTELVALNSSSKRLALLCSERAGRNDYESRHGNPAIREERLTNILRFNMRCVIHFTIGWLQLTVREQKSRDVCPKKTAGQGRGDFDNSNVLR